MISWLQEIHKMQNDLAFLGPSHILGVAFDFVSNPFGRTDHFSVDMLEGLFGK